MILLVAFADFESIPGSEDLEHKTRRQDILVDEQEIFAFFDAIIPQDIANSVAFERWRRQAEQQNPHLLYLQRELVLSYRFEPGHLLDGVTLTVPWPLLNRLEARQSDYLVPGLIREKIIWYLKALPKQIRRMLVPLPDAVTEFLVSHSNAVHPAPLVDALTQFILKRTTLAVSSDNWPIGEIPSHLLMNICVIDDAGAELAMSRDLTELQQQHGQAAQQSFVKRGSINEKVAIERDQITCWDFGDLPVEVGFMRNGQPLTGYPALIDQTDSVAIHLFDTREAADCAMRPGVRQLLCMMLKDQIKQLDKNLPGLKQASMQLASRMSLGDLKQDMLDAIIDRALLHDDPLPRSGAEFAAQCQRARNRLPEVSSALAKLLRQIGADYQTRITCLSTTRNERVKSELNEQLDHLLYRGFLGDTAWPRLQQLPRYLKGMTLRLEKLTANPERDQRNGAEVAPFWQQYLQRLEKYRKAGLHDGHLEEFRWQIEELRVSLFAQELKTPFPVSAKRLQKLWESVLP